MGNGLSSILLCGYSANATEVLRDFLGVHYHVHACNDPVEALQSLDDNKVDLILACHQANEFDAIHYLGCTRISHPETVRILVGDLSPEEVSQAISMAAVYQLLPKVWPVELVDLMVRRALENKELSYRHRHLSREYKIAEDVLRKYQDQRKNALEDNHRFDKLVYCSQSMASLCDMAKKAAKTDLPILIQGQTGTGKELLARAIHHNSGRSKHPLMVHNCGGMSDELLHSELFGHKKGAYTGAVSDRLGLLPAADGGTVFLDEIADVSMPFQISLLRFLQEGEVKPLGSDKIIHCDVRVIAATNRPLEELIKAGQFREDLFYRLNGFQLNIPPLKARPDDIEVLTEYLAKYYSQSIGRKVLGVAPEVIQQFKLYHWPGNVRELENEIKRMVAMTDNGSFVGTENMSANIRAIKVAPKGSKTLELDGMTLKEKIEQTEMKIISQTLQQFRWNQSKAARELGLSRVGLSNKIKRYGIESASTVNPNA
jgi:two-component system, NtrC family, response regulator HupR/HoxA